MENNTSRCGMWSKTLSEGLAEGVGVADGPHRETSKENIRTAEFWSNRTAIYE